MSNSDSNVKSSLGAKEFILGIQHLFAMFGATVLVPLMTGLNPAVALVTAGIGTLIFHFCTKMKVPVFLGSSFAFIPSSAEAVSKKGIPYAQGGIMVAGLLYLVFALIAYFAGADNIKKLFPPVVTGPVIVVIGIGLSSVAINDSTGWANLSKLYWTNWMNIGIAMFTLLVVVAVSIFSKGFFKLVPILIGMASGYLLCVILDATGVYNIMDYTPITKAELINLPYITKGFFTLPAFDWGTIISIAPIALVTFMEHMGDITTNSAVVGKDFFKDPGVHRTLLGDGLATSVAGFFGGPANTTYSENTGVLATTKNYNPAVLRIAACFAILLGLVGKFGAVLQTIPGPVKGGVEIILFGMIAAIGIRTLAEAKLDFTHSRNLIIVGIILVFGLGVGALGGITLNFPKTSLNISGLFIAVIFGVLANLILPQKEDATE